MIPAPSKIDIFPPADLTEPVIAYAPALNGGRRKEGDHFVTGFLQ